MKKYTIHEVIFDKKGQLQPTAIIILILMILASLMGEF